MEESEPLLLHHHHHHHPQPPSSENVNDDEYVPISYTHSPRPLRDLPFLLLYLLFSFSTFALGIFSIFHRNPNYFLSPPLLSTSLSPHLLKNLTWTLLITSLLSAPIAGAVLFLLRRFAAHLVYASLPFLFLIPTFLNLYWFLACNAADSCRSASPLAYRILLFVLVFLLVALLLWILLANRHRVRLSVRILRVSAEALADNVALLAVLPLLTLGLFVYYAAVVAFLLYARLNGKEVLVESGGRYYYGWEEERWVPAYYALAVITMVWSLTIMVEAQVYVISGTVAQWYFAQEGTKQTRSIRTSLRYIIVQLWFDPSYFLYGQTSRD